MIKNNLFNIYNGYSDKKEELEVCKHCLSEMDYKNYSSVPWNIKGNIYGKFIMLNFFNEYGKQNLKEPTHQHYPATYTEDWAQKSEESKEKSNFTCSE